MWLIRQGKRPVEFTFRRYTHPLLVVHVIPYIPSASDFQDLVQTLKHNVGVVYPTELLVGQPARVSLVLMSRSGVERDKRRSWTKRREFIQVGYLQLNGPLLINTSDVGAKLYAMARLRWSNCFLLMIVSVALLSTQTMLKAKTNETA